MTQTTAIAGLGLIGGSLAKSLMQTGEHHIIGYDICSETLEYATQNHIIHEAEADFTKAVQHADLIILAAPISETIALIHKLNEITFASDVLVSDVASVKSSILEAANRLTNERITFIGGHPMAGSHKKGITAAKSHLFENAIYVLIPSNGCKSVRVDALKGMLASTNSNFLILNPDEHDEMTGVVSHFPHLIASSLVHQAKNWEETHSFLPKLAAGGFRDITRIASSNPKMWQDIFYHNRLKMSRLLEEWILEMSTLKKLVDSDEKTAMIDYLDQAKTYRDDMPAAKRGAIPSFYDIYVDIQDQTGALASVVQLLAKEEISIKNIQILEIREGITGALRVSFPSGEMQASSYRLLQTHGYEVMTQN